MARDNQQKGLPPGKAGPERQRQGRLGHVWCTHTEHTTPATPSRVGVVASLQGHCRLEALCSRATTQVGQ